MTDPLTRFRTEAALDLMTLAQLHDRELTEETLAALCDEGFPRSLGLRLQGPLAEEATLLLDSALQRAVGPGVLDALAADFAAIYLTHGYAASPCESVWLDEDGLAMQQPMFDVRARYARFGFAAQDWRKRPDDHLVHQLQFVAMLLERGDPAALTEAAGFLDDHTLRWLPPFAQRVGARAETPFYAGLALVSSVYLEELRDLLALVLDQPRPSADEIEQRARARRQEAALPMPSTYVPGTAPSW